MEWLTFSLYAIILIEMVVLLFLYKYVLSKWNANAWEQKVKQDNGEWLVSLLLPVIDETVGRILESAPKELTKALKGELLASQGSLSRAVFHDAGEPADMILGLSTAILEGMGYKNPNPLMAAKLASILGGIATKIGQESESPSITDIPVGDAIFQ